MCRSEVKFTWQNHVQPVIYKSHDHDIRNTKHIIVFWFKIYQIENNLSIRFAKLSISSTICYQKYKKDNILFNLHKKNLEIEKKLESLLITLYIQIFFNIINEDSIL